MIVTKYTKLIHVSDAIKNGVYACKLDALNDPFEFEGIKNPNNYRVCCLTSSDKKMLMWAYYGNHRECSIQFEIPDDYLKKVEYVEYFNTHRYMDSETIIESLYRKGKEWEWEKEYRAVYSKEDTDKNKWLCVNDKCFLRAKVKQITFAVLAHKNELYQKTLKTIKKFNDSHTEMITVKKMIIKDTSSKYELVFDPQYKYEEEIE